MYDPKSPIFKYFDDLYSFCAKRNFYGTAHLSFCYCKFPNFMFCKSTNYFTTGNRLHNCLPCIEKLYDKFKSPIWKSINDLYGNCAKHNFWLLRIYHLATAHHPIIFLLQIDKLFHHWKSSQYLITEHRKIV